MRDVASRLRLQMLAIALSLGNYVAMAHAGHGTGAAPMASSRRAWAPGGECVPGVVIIKLKQSPGAGAGEARTGISTLDARLHKHGVYALEPLLSQNRGARAKGNGVDLGRIYLVRYNGEVSPHAVVQDLRRAAQLEYAEPKYLHFLAVTPNDPSFSNQGHLSVVKAAQAWEVARGEQGEVMIAVVDGGSDRQHPDLQANFWINPGEIPGNGVDDDNNGFTDDVNGWNFANNTGDPTGLSNTPGNANHGTHTAGIACAVTNNGVGVAGMSWNAKLMAVNVSAPNTDGGIAFGYEGILYAVDNGASVISLSWVGEFASAFEQDVIDYASASGVAIVAAAGNDGTTTPLYPAAYRGVLAVANTNNNDVRHAASSFGPWVDVAAPGTNILSTLHNGRYGAETGTSMSSPLVAGLVALVKTRHPAWTGVQAGEQVRVTADNIDAQNPNFAGALGRGRINALRALSESSPALRLAGVSFAESDGDGVIEPGESVSVQVKIINYLAPAANVNLELIENDPLVTLSTASVALGAIGTLEEKTPAAPLRFTVAGNAPSGHIVNFTLRIAAAGYQDVDHFTLTILPTYGNLSANNIEITVTNIGRHGFADPSQSGQGTGFKHQGGPNLLYEGAIICGTGPARISNAARGDFVGNDLLYDRDFTVASDGNLRIDRPGTSSDQESTGIFEDRAANNPLNVRITQQTFAANRAPYEDVILFHYTVENLNATELSNFHFGHFFDWDLGPAGRGDVAEYDAQRRLGYCYNVSNGPKTYAGMTVLTGENASFRAIFNNQDAVGNPSWGIYDGFTDAEKWQSLQGGASLTKAGPEDVSYVIGSGPHTIPARGKLILGFAVLAGLDLQDLQANAEAAAQFWQELSETAVGETPAPALPRAFALEQNRPNPFNPETTIHFQLPQASPITLEVFDAAGRKVRTLLHDRRAAGTYSESWDGKNDAGALAPSGVYVYRLQAGNLVQSRKMILLR